MSPVFPASQIFPGGQMTDLPEYVGAFDETALLEMVAPGNVEQGVNYSITLALLAQFLTAITTAVTIIEQGATLGDPYVVSPEEYRILFNKTVPSDSYAEIGGGAERTTPVMVRDIYGNADAFPISVSFTGTCDGIASPIVIAAPYGGYVFNPLPNGNWYLTNT